MRKTQLLLALTAIGFAGFAFATDGYFSDGYGMTAKGMGGAATAMAEDTFGGANNPASMVWVGNRIDLGADLFSPRRSAERSGSGFGGAFNGSADSGMKYFLIPEFGYNHMIKPDLSLGVSVYGNGGMNSSYPGGQIAAGMCGLGAPASNLLCGSGTLGVNLMQLIIAPTAAYKINESNSIGISPLFGFQRFKATGLDAFANTPGMSSSPANVTNQGNDDATGWGVRVGWQGRITPTLTLGAAYSSKINMGKFDKYRGLFAEGGDFDIPENYNVGLAFQAMPNLTLALDYQRINYSGVSAIGNSSSNPAQLGSSNGPGFGWKDINVWKLGAAYKMDDKLTLRAGYNHTDNPIQSADAMFNILAPGVVQDHMTLGMSYAVSKTSDLTVSYMHAFKHSVSGPDGLPAGGTDTISMYQDSLGVAYSWKM
jgi:long-chain fatty acid transport protein